MVNLRWSVCNDKKEVRRDSKESLRTIVYEELYKLEDRGREHVSAYLLSTGVYSRKSATQR